MAKRGPRAERALLRDAMARVEQECEKFVRAKMQPELLANVRAATAGFRKQRGR